MKQEPNNNQSPKTPVAIAALVATHHRMPLLETRCLPSIRAQTRPPDLLILVGDGVTPHAEQHLRALTPTAVVLLNQRTPGAAGAWNTGIQHLLDHVSDPSHWYVALLDDDDAWTPDHLERCSETAARGHDMVAAGLVRHRAPDDTGHRQSPPRALDEATFLSGNPHIQASNLFVRLETLVRAGCFDEALASCTDRDLCIRLTDLGDLRYARHDAFTVHHFAEPERARLSTPGSPAKQRGLEAFYAKYRGRMSKHVHAAFLERARALFDWSPMLPAIPSEPVDQPSPDPEPGEPLTLLLGAIVDSERHALLETLLTDLEQLAAHPSVQSLHVVLLDNGTTERADQLRTLSATHHQLRIHVIDVRQQTADARSGAFGHRHERSAGRAGIAEARTMLQTYLYHLGRDRSGAVAWVIDDDMHLGAVTPNDRVRVIQRLRKEGVAIALGGQTGAPPIPAASTIRTQLVDLLHNLAYLTRLDPDAIVPDREPCNLRARAGRRDYYYDLSRTETDRLETPFWLRPTTPRQSARETLTQLSATVHAIAAGACPLRPMVSAPRATDPSLHRGGNTLIFDLTALRDVPNLAPRIANEQTRRSDMIWALLNRHVFGKRIVEVPLPVTQRRPPRGHDRPCLASLASDIQGHALFSALSDLLSAHDPACPELAFTDDDLTLLAARYRKHVAARISAVRLAWHRIAGLAQSIDALLATGRRAKRWWSTDASLAPAIETLRTTVRALADTCHPAAVDTLEARVRQMSEHAVQAFAKSLAPSLRAHQAASLIEARTSAFTTHLRRRSARAELSSLGITSEIDDLGAGHEGVVLTDGRRVFKVFDAWRTTPCVEHLQWLTREAHRWAKAHHLIPLKLVHGPRHPMLVYPYQPSEPYHGGHGRGLVGLLRECRTHGIVCNNVRPENLRVIDGSVKLVDYGADVVPFTESGFVQMVRRTWLTWRWHHRPDLRALMTRSLTDDTMPELSGCERLHALLHAPTATVDLEDLLLEHIGAPRSVADYGCGKGKLARKIAARGTTVLAYDPDPTLTPRWHRDGHARGLTLTTDRQRALYAAPHDVVVCSRVLCTIADSGTYRTILDDLRHLVSETGRVLLTVCHPSFTLGGDTPEQRRSLPHLADPAHTFAWRKITGPSNRERTDVHRALPALRRDLLRAHLAITDLRETQTVDYERFEPASDYLTLVLKPLPTTAPRVSLLIKTCTMEATTITRQVQHLVHQLEGPTPFLERVLVVDSRRDGFTRAYAQADALAHSAAVTHLLTTGVIDRVIQAPADPATVRALNRRWFDLDSPATHAENGSPVAATLAGIEACRGEFVLQLDADLLIHRSDPSHPYLDELTTALASRTDALTISLGIVQPEDLPITAGNPTPWRVEVRGSLIHRARLLATRPLPNEQAGANLKRPWYRSLDAAILDGAGSSLRGGSHTVGFIHPPNQQKRDPAHWLTILDRVEQGFIPDTQKGHVELTGDLADWLGPKRAEPFVFVIAGRNVPPGRFRRCLQSLVAQRRPDWGAVIIDDASADFIATDIALAGRDHAHRITTLLLPHRRGSLANLVWAVRHICVDPDTVIITLDADDALLGPHVLDRVAAAYARGADLTIGSMLRTDKHTTYPVDLTSPRHRRGGNVWQHLRTFKKSLFDTLPDHLLQLDGQYIDLATDWAFMIPLVEIATHPIHIPDPLYLYEPSGRGKTTLDRPKREAVIQRILAKPPLPTPGAQPVLRPRPAQSEPDPLTHCQPPSSQSPPTPEPWMSWQQLVGARQSEA